MTENFGRILSGLLSVDGNVRRIAEDELGRQSQQLPNEMVKFCLNTLSQHGQKLEIRGLASVTLRKILQGRGDSLNENTLELVKRSTLRILMVEYNSVIRSKLHYLVAALISRAIERDEQNVWREMIEAVLGWGLCNKEKETVDSLSIIEHVCTFSDARISVLYQGIKQVLTVGLQHLSGVVRKQALKTFVAVMGIEIEEKREMVPLLSLVIEVLQYAVANIDEDSCEGCLELFVEMALNDPSVFTKTNNWEKLLTFIINIMKSSSFRIEVTSYASELLCTICETSPMMVPEKVLKEAVDVFIRFILTLRYDHEKFNSAYLDSDEVEGSITLVDLGVESLDRMARGIGGQRFFPLVYQTIQICLKSNSWQMRTAGLLSLTQISEACRSQLEPDLSDVIKLICEMASDDHERVRYGALHALAQMEMDFGYCVVENFHEMIFKVIFQILQNEKSPKVRAHCATSIINLCESVSSDEQLEAILSPYFSRLLAVFMRNITKKDTPIFEISQLLVGLIALLDRAADETTIKPFYESIFSFFSKHILPKSKHQEGSERTTAESSDTEISIQVRAIEGMGTLAKSAPTCFAQNSEKAIRMLRMAEISHADNDMLRTRVAMAWPSIASAMGAKFLPYLREIIPAILKKLNSCMESKFFRVMDIDEMENMEATPMGAIKYSEAKEGMQNVMLSIRGVGEKRIEVKTDNLEDQIFLLKILTSYVKALGANFKQFVMPCIQICAKLFKDGCALNEIAEEAKSLTLALVVMTIETSAELQDMQELIKFVFEEIVRPSQTVYTLETELGLVVCSLVYEILDKVPSEARFVDYNWSWLLEWINRLFIFLLMEKRNLREELFRERINNNGMVNQEKEKLSVEQLADLNDFLMLIFEIVGLFMKKKNLAVGAKEILGRFSGKIMEVLSNPQSSSVTRATALCFYCDFFEHCYTYEKVEDVLKSVWPIFLRAADPKNETPEVQQAAVFGIGAIVSIPTLSQLHVQTACAKLAAVLEYYETQLPFIESAVQHAVIINCVSAVLNYYTRKRNLMGNSAADKLLEYILKFLPGKGDETESRKVHKWIINQYLEGNNPVFKKNDELFVMKLIPMLLASEFVDEEDVAKLEKVLDSLDKDNIMDCT